MKNQIQRNIPTIALAVVIGFSLIYYLLVYIPANEKRVWSSGVRQLNTISKNIEELFYSYNDAIDAARGDSSFLDKSLTRARGKESNGMINFDNTRYIKFPAVFKNEHAKNSKTPEHLMKNFQDFVNLVEDFSFFEDIIIIEENQQSSGKGRVLDHSRLSISEYSLADSLLSAGVKIYETEIAPNRFYAFQRRIDLGSIQFAIVGFLSKSTFDKRTRQVDPTITIFFLLGVFLLILAWPVLKLLLITKHERLSTRDVQLTNYAVIMGVAFLTMLLGGAYVFLISLPSETDTTLGNLSKKIYNQFRNEIKERRDVLKEPKLFESAISTGKGQRDYGSFRYNEIFSVETQQGLVTKLLTEPSNHKFDEFKAKSVDVRTRPYFAALIEPAKEEIFNTYYIQSIKSRATGIQECAISIPYCLDSALIEIRVITSHLPSVINPILPYNYGFAIFDSKGAVQFHSDSRKVINENFLEECGNDSKLRSFVENNSTGYLNLDYGDQRCRVHFQPLEVGDWYIVTFYRKNHTDTFASSTLSFSLASFAGIWLYIILLHLLFMLDALRFKVVKGREFFYQWLNPVNIPQGKLKFLILFIIAIAVLDCVWWLHGQSVTGTFLWVYLTVSIAYLVVYHRLRIKRNAKDRSRFEIVLAGLILVWSVLFISNGMIREDFLATCIFLACAMVLLALGRLWKSDAFFVKLTEDEYVSSAGDYRRYRWFLVSLLLILAIFPSLFFFTDHFNHEKVIRARKALITEIMQVYPTTIEDIVADKKRGTPPVNYDSNLVTHLDSIVKGNPYFAEPDTWFYDRTINYFGQDELEHRGLVLAKDLSAWDFMHDMDKVYVKNPMPFFTPDENKIQRTYSSLQLTNLQFGFSSIQYLFILIIILLLLIIGLWRILFEIIRRIFYLPLYCEFKPYQKPAGEVQAVNEHETKSPSNDKGIIHAFGNPVEGEINLLWQLLDKYESEKYMNLVRIESLPRTYDKTTAVFEQNTFSTERKFLETFKLVWSGLSDDAKYFLYDLAEDGIVNQYDIKVLYELYEKNFITLMPLQIVHPSVTHFVMETTNIDYLKEVKTRSGTEGRWNHFKIPFGLLIIAILGFLSMVEEGLFARISALLASIGFILPGLIEVVSSWPKLWPGKKG